MRTGREQRRLPAMQQLHVDAAAGDQWRVTARRRRNNATDYSAPRSQRPAADRGDKCQMPSPSPRRFIVANHVPPMMAYVLLPPAIHSSLSLSPHVLAGIARRLHVRPLHGHEERLLNKPGIKQSVHVQRFLILIIYPLASGLG